MFWIFPLESYESRYTCQQTQWIQNNLKGREISFIVGKNADQTRVINKGAVLDATGRSKYAMEQIAIALDYIDQGRITPDDQLFFVDVWHPGLQAIPYAMQQIYGRVAKMGGFWHAQSIDEYDFTAKMRDWIPAWEYAILDTLDYTFVACPTMKNLILERYPDLRGRNKLQCIGLMFDHESVMKAIPVVTKENRVVFSSRLDPEKQPEFFLKVIDRLESMLPLDEGPLTYVICSGRAADKCRPELLELFKEYEAKYADRFVVRFSLTKAEYYEEIARAKIQFNCALQDFIAYTLIEGICARCFPVYPYFRSFPETLNYSRSFMYQPWSATDAALCIVDGLHPDHHTPEAVADRMWIAEQCTPAMGRMYDHLTTGSHTPWRLDG